PVAGTGFHRAAGCWTGRGRGGRLSILDDLRLTLSDEQIGADLFPGPFQPDHQLGRGKQLARLGLGFRVLFGLLFQWVAAGALLALRRALSLHDDGPARWLETGRRRRRVAATGFTA